MTLLENNCGGTDQIIMMPHRSAPIFDDGKRDLATVRETPHSNSASSKIHQKLSAKVTA